MGQNDKNYHGFSFNYLPPSFSKWPASPYLPFLPSLSSPPVFCLISRLVLKLTFLDQKYVRHAKKSISKMIFFP